MQTMNRAERRKLGKNKGQRVLNPAVHWGTTSTRLVMHSNDCVDSGILNDICLPLYSALESIVRGDMGEDQFRKLWEMFEFGVRLCKRLKGFSANQETVDLLDRVQPAIQSGYDLLYPLTERMEEEGRYRVRPPELETLREAVRLLTELLEVSTQGHTLTCMMQADENLENGKDFLTQLSIQKVLEAQRIGAMQQQITQGFAEVNCGS